MLPSNINNNNPLACPSVDQPSLVNTNYHLGGITCPAKPAGSNLKIVGQTPVLSSFYGTCISNSPSPKSPVITPIYPVTACPITLSADYHHQDYKDEYHQCYVTAAIPNNSDYDSSSIGLLTSNKSSSTYTYSTNTSNSSCFNQNPLIATIKGNATTSVPANGGSLRDHDLSLTCNDVTGSSTIPIKSGVNKSSKLVVTSSSPETNESSNQQILTSVERSKGSTTRTAKRFVSPCSAVRKVAPTTPPRISSKARSISCDSKKILTTASIIHSSEVAKLSFVANGKYNNVSIHFYNG